VLGLWSGDDREYVSVGSGTFGNVPCSTENPAKSIDWLGFLLP
jgi:hypothetical protein